MKESTVQTVLAEKMSCFKIIILLINLDWLTFKLSVCVEPWTNSILVWLFLMRSFGKETAARL